MCRLMGKQAIAVGNIIHLLLNIHGPFSKGVCRLKDHLFIQLKIAEISVFQEKETIGNPALVNHKRPFPLKMSFNAY